MCTFMSLFANLLGLSTATRNCEDKRMHRFGGEWTEEKLQRVESYLSAYSTALKNQRFTRVYIDAIAGTGYRSTKGCDDTTHPMFPDMFAEETRTFLAGSVRRALGVTPQFDEYHLIDKDPAKCRELRTMIESDFPDLRNRVIFQATEANQYLKRVCLGDWIADKRRGVLFLDPYGMQVEWNTIVAIAQTEAIDLWVLFPLGVAVNRLLPKSGDIAERNRAALDRIFGTRKWEDAFYETDTRSRFLWEEAQAKRKKADFEAIGRFYIERLRGVFPGVAENPLYLCNSRNNPLYLLCFACGNPKPKAKGLALKIARHILNQ